MDGKLLILVLGIVNYSNCAGLLRTPKVYNAVITTDDNLTPSRAFPVIQPTIHETGIASYPFGPFNPYRFYNPSIVHLGQPIPQGLFARTDQVPIQPPVQRYNRPQFEMGPRIPAPEQIIPEMAIRENESPLSPPEKQDPITMVPEEKIPIPLNEFGLPPSLIPVQSYPPQRPVNLQPYPYNHYPLIYESFNQYPDHLLPPYGYFPPHSFGIRPPPKQSKKPMSPSQGVNSKKSPDNPKENPETGSNGNFDSIKNGITNKNSEVPDVPPPPLPSGAKSSE